MDATIKKSNQIITVSARERIEINEVDSIINFDTEGITIMTQLGKIYVEGNGLEILDLNKEKRSIEIRGNVSGVFYLDKTEKKKRGVW